MFQEVEEDRDVLEAKTTWFGLSPTTLILIFIGIFLLGFYIGILLFGENSIEVLDELHNEKVSLESEKRHLQEENQKLQKVYFELFQIIGD